jgi:agmatine deiminase
VYAEIVRALHVHERVDILVQNEEAEAGARARLASHGVHPDGYRMHRVPTDRSWLRDSGPTGVHDSGGAVTWLDWGFNAWAKYDNFGNDSTAGAEIAGETGLPRVEPTLPGGKRIILEGGGIETDGAGTLLVTEEWLLSDVQVRNEGMDRAAYERMFAEWLGIARTIWLGEGCEGDDTHGHVDDIARFASPGVVLLAHDDDPSTENHRRSRENLARLRAARDAAGNPLLVVPLPFPRRRTMDEVVLPASYANFYIANDVVLVPTFNDPADRLALETIAECFPGRTVTGISSVDLVWGLGTLHCLTQQQPARRTVD